MKIQKNLGVIERVARIAIGAILLLIASLAFVGSASVWALFGLLGVFPLIAGIVGFCPRYALMGINTCKVRQEPGGRENKKCQTQACC
jgi:hypothetical protein